MTISVIMPAYNAEKYLAEAIESILNQSYEDFEFIIIDDGSTDRSLEIIQSYAEKDSRIEIVHGRHRGVSAALNLGVAAAKHEWIAVMHADDIAMPKRLERQLDYVQRHPSVVIWGSNGYRISSKGKIVADMTVGPTSIEACEGLRQRAEIVQAMHPTVMLRRDVALEVGGYDSDFDGAEDIELFDRMLEHGHLVSIDEKLLQYRIHGSSITVSKSSFQKQVVEYLKLRQKARLSGQGAISFQDFQAQRAKASLWHKWVYWNTSTVAAYYHCAGIMLPSGQRLKGILYFLGAFFVNPFYTVRRLYNQLAPLVLRRRA